MEPGNLSILVILVLIVTLWLYGTLAATAAPLTASVLRTAWRAARLVHWRVAAPGGGARSLARIR